MNYETKKFKPSGRDAEFFNGFAEPDAENFNISQLKI